MELDLIYEFHLQQINNINEKLKKRNYHKEYYHKKIKNKEKKPIDKHKAISKPTGDRLDYINKYAKEYYRDNIEYYRAYHRDYYIKNKYKLLEKKRKQQRDRDKPIIKSSKNILLEFN